MTDVGLVSYGLYTPAEFETAAEIAAKAGLTAAEVRALGIEKKCRPSPDDQPIPMAVKAARQAFERAEMRPEEVDLVLWTGEEYKDYIAQTASIRLQEETGCRRAWAFDLVGQGVTLLVGLRVARDLMIGDESVRIVLLAGGSRNVDLVDYGRPDTRFMLAASASGGAMILKRGHPRNRLLNAAIHVDPDMADEVYVPGGGTEIPFSHNNLGSELMFFQARHPEALAEYLAQAWTANLTGVIKKALGNDTPDYLALRHLAPADRSKVLKDLGLSPKQSASLEQWGHHGTNDVILSLDLGLKTGEVKEGSLVVMCSAGIGFTYAAASIRWGLKRLGPRPCKP
ncbi:MAG: 3-oxoacyl-[acyl-carrier-protein] synthase III C-terminal domain-containing protein, partial [Pseudomonadota bacterium]